MFLLQVVVGYVVCSLVNKRVKKWMDGRFFEPGRMAMHEFYDLRAWLLQKMEDPAMSDRKWFELIPIAQFADYRYRKLWRPLDFPQSCQAIVMQMLPNEDEEWKQRL